MGAALSSTVLGVERPRVGLLSNGEEAERGSPLVVEAHAELVQRAGAARAFEFVGNVEGGDVTGGAADVIVTDGFTGNVALKLIEGVVADDPRRGQGCGHVLDAREARRAAAAGRARGLSRGDRPGAAGRRVPARAAPPGRRAARALSRTGFAQAILRAERGAREDIVGQTERALARAGALRESPVSAPAASLAQTE